jgi:ribonuclease Z
MSSHNLARLKIDDLEVIGYSFAGEETVVAVPQLDVCFDIGKAPDQVISINNVLLTHGHMDHAAGIAYYLSHRNFCDLPAGTILAPAHLIDAMRQVIAGWVRLDGNRIPANLVGVKPGDEHRVKANLFMKVFPTKHSRGSVGYCVIERRKKLKNEYAGLSGPQLVELKKKGVEIEYRLDLPVVTYLGDTQYVDFSRLDYIARSKILIAECTFYVDEHEGRAKAGRHMHIREFAGMLESLDNEHIVITHTSQRTPIREVKKILRESLPAAVYKKSVLLMDNKKRGQEPFS